MIFVDTNVIVYAVGSEHPLLAPSVQFFREIRRNATPLVISSEVLQELLHVYQRVGRVSQWDDALALLYFFSVDIQTLTAEDVMNARLLHDRFPDLQARDLCYLAVSQRVGASSLKTFDRRLGLAAASLLA